jgi:hypothetical protein
MKSHEPRVFSKEVATLAADVEREFFRIEKDNLVLASAINGVIAGAAVGLVSWLVTTLHEGDILLFACLGSSAASVVFAPLAKNNSLRSIFLAYVLSSAMCLLINPLRHYELLPVSGLCFVAVSGSIFLMRLCGAMHPAAIGSAMAFVIYSRDPRSLLLLLLAIIGLLTIVKILAYIYLEDLMFKDFHREFRRDYYGRETAVTIEPKAMQSKVSVEHSAPKEV